ncbi:MAG: D-alanine-D-alanine ligase [Candidatus Gottesmanbacteria bacterium GW2011_GWA1_34_13]|uniref:D-alanine-D-alanine ligase n=1 Tax=Candidatus Gottesmanbacteria bacterium GW2011_GWA1_34_13 TaxID=1618434 RepID=A0A0G0D7F9_9BACT|nr:MAG: D-alanine-D-alanine ligase [Candidatus Gottesmanbacteria bacterium GW2011_GWA1_34_13]
MKSFFKGNKRTFQTGSKNMIKKSSNGFLPQKAGIIYSDVKRSYFPTMAQYITEKNAFSDAVVIGNFIKKLGINIKYYPGNASLAEKLRRYRPQVVINLVGSVKGNEYLASGIPGILEILDIPYTGTGILGESLSYNKFLVKKLFEQNGVPIPRYQLFNSSSDPIDPTLRYPLISKLNEIHGSVEITKDAVSENEKELRKRLRFLINTYEQPVLVEEFIVGREITAILLEGLNKKVYLAEKIFNNQENSKYSYVSFDMQWLPENNNAISYQKFKDPLLTEYVKRAFEITDMYDYGKFDIRLDNSGRYYFLDSNSNPFLGPKETGSALGAILDLYGVSFSLVLKRLLLNTVRDAAGKKLLPFTNVKS